MRLHVMSDLHFEHRSKEAIDIFFETLRAKVSLDKPEVLVLAGDITNFSKGYKDRAVSQLKELARIYPAVVYITGNHEYYDTSFDKVNAILDEMRLIPNIHILDCDTTATVAGQVFRGDTMWFDYPPHHLNPDSFSDFRLIEGLATKVYKRNEAFVKDVIPNIQPSDIVVTHHMPFEGSISERFKGSMYNYFFKFECSAMMSDANSPKLWIHGHTHDPQDYKTLNGTRVYCNPLAYPNEGSNDDFWDRILVVL